MRITILFRKHQRKKILFFVTAEILNLGFLYILIPKNNFWQIIKEISAPKNKLIRQSDSDFHFISTLSPKKVFDEARHKLSPVVSVDEDRRAVVLISGNAQTKNLQGVKSKHLTCVLSKVKRKVFWQDASIPAANPLGSGDFNCAPFSSIVSCS